MRERQKRRENDTFSFGSNTLAGTHLNPETKIYLPDTFLAFQVRYNVRERQKRCENGTFSLGSNTLAGPGAIKYGQSCIILVSF